MKQRILLVTAIFLTILTTQSCKKASTDTATTTSTVLFQDDVNGTLWTPTSTSAMLTYSAANSNKTLVCTAINTATSDKLVFTLVIPAANADNTFTAQTYTVNNANLTAMYYTLNTATNVYTPVGTLTAGNLVITTFDSTANTMTGTFAFSFAKNNYDSNGNLLSITANGITAGQFNSLLFTFAKQ